MLGLGLGLVLGLGPRQAAGQRQQLQRRRGEVAGPWLRAGGGRPRLTAAHGRAGPRRGRRAAPVATSARPGRRSAAGTLPFGKGKRRLSQGARGPPGVGGVRFVCSSAPSAFQVMGVWLGAAACPRELLD